MKNQTDDSPLILSTDVADILGLSTKELEWLRRRKEIVGEPFKRYWWQLFPTWKYRLNAVRVSHRAKFGDGDTYPLREESVGEVRYFLQSINSLVQKALNDGASGMHILPSRSREGGERAVVRFWIDGMLRESVILTAESWRKMSQQLLLMADETTPFPSDMAPQQGVVRFSGPEQEIWVRFATIHSSYGTTVVLHFTPSAAPESLAALGLTDPLQQSLAAQLLDPTAGGLVLFAAPQGEGLTTTLRTAIMQVNRPHRDIYFFDDIADFPTGGVTRVIYDNVQGMSARVAVEMALRQGADLLVFGNIAHRETALVAIEAAEAGKTVWAAVRVPGFLMGETPDNAVQILKLRMQGWGIAPERLERILSGAILQRLHRKLCPDCLEDVIPNPWERHMLERFAPAKAKRTYRATGCGFCRSTGYRGCSGLFLVYRPNVRYSGGYEGPVSFNRFATSLFASGDIDARELFRLQARWVMAAS